MAFTAPISKSLQLFSVLCGGHMCVIRLLNPFWNLEIRGRN